jgi:hypothetical protein
METEELSGPEAIRLLKRQGKSQAEGMGALDPTYQRLVEAVTEGQPLPEVGAGDWPALLRHMHYNLATLALSAGNPSFLAHYKAVPDPAL